MQAERAKRAEIAFRRGHFWHAAEAAPHFECALPDRRAFFAAAAMAGRLRPPILEIGAEYAVNGMLLEHEMGLPTASVDLSRRALQASVILARLLGLIAPSSRVAADGERLPFPAASFRTVLLWGTLHHWDRPGALLDEIWRVLAPGGAVIVAEEPIRRRLRIPLFRTQASDRLRGLTRWLLKLGWLPYLARIGGHDETRHGVIERDFAPMGLSRLFARYTDAAWFFTPSLTGGASALGPLARRLWRVDGADAAKMRGLASWFGGAVRGWLTKPLGVRALSPGRYLVRKDPRHDRVAVRGFSGAFLADGQTLAADHETAELPRETLGRVHLLLDIPRPFQRIDLWSSDGGTGLATHFPPGEAEAPASVPDVACPDCVEFTARCIYGFCARECVAACPRDALAPTDPRLPVRASCNGCGACLRACPYGGLDRPRLGDGRCPSCRRLFSAEADVLDCRPRTLGERIDLAALETVSLENVWT